MACEDIEERADSPIDKIEPPAIPVAKPDPTVQDDEQHNNVLRLFFNRLVNAINKLADQISNILESISNIEGDITEIQEDITNIEEIINEGDIGDGDGSDGSDGDTGQPGDGSSGEPGDPGDPGDPGEPGSPASGKDGVGGGAGTWKAYRYWRLINPTVNPTNDVGSFYAYTRTDTQRNQKLSLQEIGLYVYDGADRIAVQKEATCTFTTPDSPVNVQINDGFTTSTNPGWWETETVETPYFYIQWDFGADNEKALSAIRQFPTKGGFAGYAETTRNYLSRFTIQASDDGVNWDLTLYVSNQYVSNSDAQWTDNSGLPSFDSGTWSEYYYLHRKPTQFARRPYRYWKLANATFNETNLVLDQIALLTTAGASEQNVAPEATITGTAALFGNPEWMGRVISSFSDDPSVLTTIKTAGEKPDYPPFATNSNPTSYTTWTTPDSSFYLQWDFGEGNEKLITGVKQLPGDSDPTSGANPVEGIATFEMLASDDAVNWRTYYVDHQYVSGVLPTPTMEEWSEVYWLHEHEAATGGGVYWNFVQPAKFEDFTAVAGNFYFVDVNDGGADVTLTLPASPSVGDRVGVRSVVYDINYEVTINTNGENWLDDICPPALGDSSVSTNYQAYEMIFIEHFPFELTDPDPAETGWIVYNNVYGPPPI